MIQEKLKTESLEFKSIFREDFTKIEKELSKLEGKIEVRIEQSKSDMVKWFVSLFVALALMIIGLYIKK